MLTPEQESAAQVKTAWDIFDGGWTEQEMIIMLTLAGVVPAATQYERIYQCLIVWFGGNIPNITEANRLMKRTLSETLREQ